MRFLLLILTVVLMVKAMEEVEKGVLRHYYPTIDNRTQAERQFFIDHFTGK